MSWFFRYNAQGDADQFINDDPIQNFGNDIYKGGEKLALFASIITLTTAFLTIVVAWDDVLSMQINKDGDIPIRLYHLAGFLGLVLLFIINGLLIFFYMRRNSELSKKVNFLGRQLILSNKRYAPQTRLFTSYTQLVERLDQISNKLVRHMDNLMTGLPYERHDYTQTMIYTVDQVRGIFERLTGRRCSVCIKYCVDLEDDDFDGTIISTLVRDSISYQKRKYVDAEDFKKYYDMSSNTAFDSITSPTTDDIVFLCNDLKKFDEEYGYQNSNKHWRKYYDSCLVVPITSPAGSVRKDLFGFLCVDNFGGGFEEQSAVPIARMIANMIFADMLYYYMDISDEIIVEGEKDEKTEKTDDKKTRAKAKKEPAKKLTK